LLDHRSSSQSGWNVLSLLTNREPNSPPTHAALIGFEQATFLSLGSDSAKFRSRISDAQSRIASDEPGI
jgi:hypothetical protein